MKAIEVVDYDETEAVARPLKVEFRKGRWLLASHDDYPAEARDRLAKTASALLDIRKDSPATDRVEDHTRFGVLDPLDARNPSLKAEASASRCATRGAQHWPNSCSASQSRGKPVIAT